MNQTQNNGIATKITHFIESHLATWQWWVLGIIAMAISQYTMGWLNGLYAQTLFPVSFMEGQTAFHGPTIKGYYAFLLEKGTFGQYYFVQIVDYLFMMTVFASNALLCIAVYRSMPEVRGLKAIALFMVFTAPQAATFDALENAVSFIMLADPTQFADWLAYPYSSFAVAKFMVFSLAYIWIALGILIGAGAQAVRLVNRKQHKLA